MKKKSKFLRCYETVYKIKDLSNLTNHELLDRFGDDDKKLRVTYRANKVNFFHSNDNQGAKEEIRSNFKKYNSLTSRNLKEYIDCKQFNDLFQNKISKIMECRENKNLIFGTLPKKYKDFILKFNKDEIQGQNLKDMILNYKDKGYNVPHLEKEFVYKANPILETSKNRAIESSKTRSKSSLENAMRYVENVNDQLNEKLEAKFIEEHPCYVASPKKGSLNKKSYSTELDYRKKMKSKFVVKNNINENLKLKLNNSKCPRKITLGSCTDEEIKSEIDDEIKIENNECHLSPYKKIKNKNKNLKLKLNLNLKSRSYTKLNKLEKNKTNKINKTLEDSYTVSTVHTKHMTPLSKENKRLKSQIRRLNYLIDNINVKKQDSIVDPETENKRISVNKEKRDLIDMDYLKMRNNFKRIDILSNLRNANNEHLKIEIKDNDKEKRKKKKIKNESSFFKFNLRKLKSSSSESSNNNNKLFSNNLSCSTKNNENFNSKNEFFNLKNQNFANIQNLKSSKTPIKCHQSCSNIKELVSQPQNLLNSDLSTNQIRSRNKTKTIMERKKTIDDLRSYARKMTVRPRKKSSMQKLGFDFEKFFNTTSKDSKMIMQKLNEKFKLRKNSKKSFSNFYELEDEDIHQEFTFDENSARKNAEIMINCAYDNLQKGNVYEAFCLMKTYLLKIKEVDIEDVKRLFDIHNRSNFNAFNLFSRFIFDIKKLNNRVEDYNLKGQIKNMYVKDFDSHEIGNRMVNLIRSEEGLRESDVNFAKCINKLSYEYNN